MSARERELRAALDHAYAATGALRDALSEEQCGDGTPATVRAIDDHRARARRHTTQLLVTLSSAAPEAQEPTR